jgi:hydroxymethylpyrimidine/phosphomethylpyrimidine kinase
MLLSADIIRAVSKSLTDYSTIPLVIDPVMVAKGGAKLLEEDAIEALCGTLIPKATLLTPNIPEASLLAEMEIKTVADMEKAGLKLLSTYHPQAVLMKGGHLEGFMTITNLLITDQGVKTYTSGKINSQNTHGTGCTLASAIATYLARGERMSAAVDKAIQYVEGAIRGAVKLGSGHGPLHHGWQKK